MLNPAQGLGHRIDTPLGKLALVRFLGKGKSGYSYLALKGKQQYVVKLMHDEPCDYYHFDKPKLELEQLAYQQLEQLGIRVPKLLACLPEHNALVKEYIEGDLISEAIIDQRVSDKALSDVFAMYQRLKQAGLNIDYFPDNFLFSQHQLYYVDYEVNAYEAQWDLANWGLYYWANSEGMRAYRHRRDFSLLHDDSSSGKPRREPFEQQVQAWIKRYGREEELA